MKCQCYIVINELFSSKREKNSRRLCLGQVCLLSDRLENILPKNILLLNVRPHDPSLVTVAMVVNRMTSLTIPNFPRKIVFKNLFLSLHHLSNLHILKTRISLEQKEIFENSKRHFCSHAGYLFMF